MEEEHNNKTFVRQKSRSRSFLKSPRKTPDAQKKGNKLVEKAQNLKKNIQKKQMAAGKSTKSPARASSRVGREGKSPRQSKSPHRSPYRSPNRPPQEQKNDVPANKLPSNQKHSGHKAVQSQQNLPLPPLPQQQLPSRAQPHNQNLRESMSVIERKTPSNLYRSISIDKVNPRRSVSRSQTKKQIKQFDTDLTFRPMLSKKSLQIASTLERSVDRLTKNMYKREDSRDEANDRAGAKPKINKMSEQMAAKATGPTNARDRFERLYQYSRIYKETNNNLRIKKIEEDLQKEIVINKPKTPERRKTPNRDGNEHFFTSEVDVSERNNMWQSKMKDKIERMKSQQTDMELQDCTFKPKTVASRTSYRRQSSKSLAKTSEFMKEGLTDHFTRAEMAKQKKGYADINRKKSLAGPAEPTGETPKAAQGSRRFVEPEESESASHKEPEGNSSFHQMNQKWSNTHAMASAKDSTDRQKLSNMLENLKRMM
jgi:hypothetical protein